MSRYRRLRRLLSVISDWNLDLGFEFSFVCISTVMFGVYSSTVNCCSAFQCRGRHSPGCRVAVVIVEKVVSFVIAALRGSQVVSYSFLGNYIFG